MTAGVSKVLITAEFTDDQPPDYSDVNSDVIVEFDNGDQYVATFYSLKNLEKMINELKNDNGITSAPFYKLLNIVLVKDFNNGDLLPVIDEMIAEGDFQLIFRKA